MNDARNRLTEEIKATKQIHHETKLRLEDLERVADTVNGISLLGNVSEEVKESTIEAIVNEALEGRATRLIDRVKGGKA